MNSQPCRDANVEPTVQPVHLVVPGCERGHLTWCVRLLAGPLLAWFLHVAILVIGTGWLIRGEPHASYEFGIQRASLAPLSHRLMATIIDAFLVMAAPILLWRVVFWGQPIDERLMALHLFSLEYDLVSVLTRVGLAVPLTGGFAVPPPQVVAPINWPKFLLGNDLRTFGIVVAAAFVVWSAKLYLEGRFGFTPGKWLMGIRTVRTTLRPCGFARVLVRDVLLFGVDVPYLLTPIPAAISFVLSDHHQRLGDRVADTVVIRAGSIREVDHSASGHE